MNWSHNNILLGIWSNVYMWNSERINEHKGRKRKCIMTVNLPMYSMHWFSFHFMDVDV